MKIGKLTAGITYLKIMQKTSK